MIKAEIFFDPIGNKKREIKRVIEFDGSDLGLIQAIEKMRSVDEQRDAFDFWSITKINRLPIEGESSCQ